MATSFRAGSQPVVATCPLRALPCSSTASASVHHPASFTAGRCGPRRGREVRGLRGGPLSESTVAAARCRSRRFHAAKGSADHGASWEMRIVSFSGKSIPGLAEIRSGPHALPRRRCRRRAGRRLVHGASGPGAGLPSGRAITPARRSSTYRRTSARRAIARIGRIRLRRLPRFHGHGASKSSGPPGNPARFRVRDQAAAWLA